MRRGGCKDWLTHSDDSPMNVNLRVRPGEAGADETSRRHKQFMSARGAVVPELPKINAKQNEIHRGWKKCAFRLRPTPYPTWPAA
jgi:hypothetical protein